jgi:hypothetical protein
VIIRDVIPDQTSQMNVIEDDHVIECYHRFETGPLSPV